MNTETLTAAATADVTACAVEPFLHVSRDRLYNPLTDRELLVGQPGFDELHTAALAGSSPVGLPSELGEQLRADGWLQSDPDAAAGSRYRLKYVSLEAHTVCNQACYFCPVSFAPREHYFMPSDQYRSIVQQLTRWRDTIEAVFMINYNEPTADPRFVEQVATIRDAGLHPAVLTNGSGLTPQRIDELRELGGLRYLSINLSTIDRERYRETRGGDHLKQVLRNIDYLREHPVAESMEVIVLGTGDAAHLADHQAIVDYFAGSPLTVKRYRLMDRAGLLTIGDRPAGRSKRLAGCDNIGSRPLQHLHITPQARAVLCCEDYDEKYVVGDLNVSTVEEVLAGPEIAKLRRWVYGLEEAPADFMCRKCVFARFR
jgi:pyruvate-formate lyase-activating enzyme